MRDPPKLFLCLLRTAALLSTSRNYFSQHHSHSQCVFPIVRQRKRFRTKNEICWKLKRETSKSFRVAKRISTGFCLLAKHEKNIFKWNHENCYLDKWMSEWVSGKKVSEIKLMKKFLCILRIVQILIQHFTSAHMSLSSSNTKSLRWFKQLFKLINLTSIFKSSFKTTCSTGR